VLRIFYGLTKLPVSRKQKKCLLAQHVLSCDQFQFRFFIFYFYYPACACTKDSCVWVCSSSKNV